MAKPTKEQIFADIKGIIEGLSEDWEFTGEITPKTTVLEDLSFESIDVVALGTAIEEFYKQSLLFAEYLSGLEEQKVADLTLGEIVEFVWQHLQTPERKG